MSRGGDGRDRELRRAAIYEKRARQLRRRKAVCFCLLATLIAGLVGVRFLGTRMTREGSAVAGALALAGEEQTGDAQVFAFGQTTDDARGLTTDDALTSAGGETRDNAPASTGLLAPYMIAAPAFRAPADEPVLYAPKADITPSVDAMFFFDGYQVLYTEDTVFLESSTDATRHFASDPDDLLQGAADSHEDNEPVISDEDVFLDSASAVLIDLDTGEVLCARNPEALIYPASMTKILTLLVANEQITDRTTTFTITKDITDLTFSESLSSVFWQVGETVTLADLEYGTILPSGADAAIGLARVASGSEEAHVQLMNDKIRSLGLSEGAHFSNVTGMFAPDNLCTVVDMAMIMKACAENAHVLDVLAMREYTTTKTAEHPNGVYMFNLFLDRTDLRTELNGTVICAKTGYTQEALNCAVSYYVSDSGKHYVCVTALGRGGRRVVQDHVNLYTEYAK